MRYKNFKKKLLKHFLFIIPLLIGQALCFSQNLNAKRIDDIIKQSEVGKSALLEKTGKSFLLEKSCIDLKKDTINYYKDTGNYYLVKVTRTLYNPLYLKNLRKDFWTYYFLNGNLIMVTNEHVVDFARVYSYTNYYFNNRKFFHRFGIKYNLKKPAILLKQGDDYFKKAKEKACR